MDELGNELRALVPAECLRTSELRSWGALLRDLSLVVALYAIRPWLPVVNVSANGVLALGLHLTWTFALGTTFAALFVVAHDGMHGTFSRHRWVNTLVGHLAFLPLLMPFPASRVIHLRHHLYTNHVEFDTQYRPRQRHEVGWNGPLRLGFGAEPARLAVLDPTAAGVYRSRRARLAAGGSIALVLAFLLATVALAGQLSTWLCAFGLPWVVATTWTHLVTWLQHADPEHSAFDKQAYSFLRGQLQTRDRSFGWLFDGWVHHGGYHLAEHLHPGRIPHYHWAQASRRIHAEHPEFLDRTGLFGAILRAWRCHHVEPQGNGEYRWRTRH